MHARPPAVFQRRFQTGDPKTEMDERLPLLQIAIDGRSIAQWLNQLDFEAGHVDERDADSLCPVVDHFDIGASGLADRSHRNADVIEHRARPEERQPAHELSSISWRSSTAAGSG